MLGFLTSNATRPKPGDSSKAVAFQPTIFFGNKWRVRFLIKLALANLVTVNFFMGIKKMYMFNSPVMYSY
ncbi:hypothetical protein CLI64_18110 [Nostoc sp. CENA543]|nr:hypothetical protein CLI64_18110 [Nostoc sp. CENA543]